MLNRTYDNQVCSIARTLELVGERWTLLILRDAFRGIRRFDAFQRSLGVARNVLTDRLQLLVDAGILERHRYSERPPRDEYRLTDRGRDLYPDLRNFVSAGRVPDDDLVRALAAVRSGAVGKNTSAACSATSWAV